MSDPDPAPQSMAGRTDWFNTARYGKLHVRQYGPPAAAHVVVVIHGLGDHGGTYARMGQALGERGIATFAYDHLGHGMTRRENDHPPTYQALLRNVDDAVAEAADRYPGARIHLLGHSMGGNLMLCYLLGGIQQDDPDATLRTTLSTTRRNDLTAIAVNPMLLPPNPPTKPQIFAAWATGKLFGWVNVSGDIDPDQLTQDPRIIQEMLVDPLMQDKMRLGLGTELLSHGQWCVDHAGSLVTQTFVLLGEDDELCDRGAIDAFTHRAGHRVAVREFETLRHNLLLEIDRQKVFDAIVDWVLS